MNVVTGEQMPLQVHQPQLFADPPVVPSFEQFVPPSNHSTHNNFPIKGGFFTSSLYAKPDERREREVPTISSWDEIRCGNLSHLYLVIPRADALFITIDDFADLDEVVARFPGPTPAFRPRRDALPTRTQQPETLPVIDFAAVASAGYSGISVSKRMTEQERGPQLSSFRGWDAEQTLWVAWDIEEVSFLRTLLPVTRRPGGILELVHRDVDRVLGQTKSSSTVNRFEL